MRHCFYKNFKTDHVQCLGGSPGHCTSQHWPATALHMLSFENFVKSMPPSLSELKVRPSFCFAFKIPDDRAVTNNYEPKQNMYKDAIRTINMVFGKDSHRRRKKHWHT